MIVGAIIGLIVGGSLFGTTPTSFLVGAAFGAVAGGFVGWRNGG